MSKDVSELFKNLAQENERLAVVLSEPFVRAKDFVWLPGPAFDEPQRANYIGSCAYYLTAEGDSEFGLQIEDGKPRRPMEALTNFAQTYGQTLAPYHDLTESLIQEYDEVTEGLEYASEDVMGKTGKQKLHTSFGLIVTSGEDMLNPVGHIVVPRAVVQEITSSGSMDVRDAVLSGAVAADLLEKTDSTLLREQYGVFIAAGLMPSVSVITGAFAQYN
jgi:hypothetical protein